MGFNIFSALNSSNEGYLIPTRDPGAASGSKFIQDNMNLEGAQREQNILDEFMHGNVPDFIRDFTEIKYSDGRNNITYLVTTDYLSLGSNDDYVRMPMNPLTAQKLATKFDCTLPTRKMVKDIWIQSENRLTPLPWGPPYNHDMVRTHRIWTHSSRINEQLANRNKFALTSGHKKDVVLTNRLYPNNRGRRVAIYGWIQPNGVAIQDLNPTSHEDTYADYSHGIRLIANDVIVNGNIMRIQEVFANPHLAPLVSDEGPLKFTKY